MSHLYSCIVGFYKDDPKIYKNELTYPIDMAATARRTLLSFYTKWKCCI